MAVAMPRAVEPSVRLVPMSPAERYAFLEREVVEYADQKARAGLWSREESLARAREEIEATLRSAPEGIPHRFFRALDAGGETVGGVWFGPVPEAGSDPRDRWLYQLIVDAPLRGRGYGRALLSATEAEARSSGGRRLRLNVFAWNRPAVSLYRSSGYAVAAEYRAGLEMTKPLE